MDNDVNDLDFRTDKEIINNDKNAILKQTKAY